MYNPAKFKSYDLEEAFSLMEGFPFATLISVIENEPIVSHLPLTPQWQDKKIILVGHLARANPHWRVLAKTSITAIFHGPHTFITPKWYVKNDVPTWNYSTVHATGRVQLIEDFEGILTCLKNLAAHAEKHWPSGWDFFVPENLKGDALTKSIVGFKVQVDEINYKKKLGQNRSAEDRAGIIKGLQSRSDGASLLVLNDMLNAEANSK